MLLKSILIGAGAAGAAYLIARAVAPTQTASALERLAGSLDELRGVLRTQIADPTRPGPVKVTSDVPNTEPTLPRTDGPPPFVPDVINQADPVLNTGIAGGIVAGLYF